jgi:hypothetical protein
MSKEHAQQYEIFTGELVDNRTRKQKKRDRTREQPNQAEMFSQRDLAQFGTKANPKLPIAPKTKMELMIEDKRNEEEIMEDRLREAEKETHSLF